MEEKMKKIVIDIDGTLTVSDNFKSYENLEPNQQLIEKLHEYKKMGFTIVLFTARGMRSQSGDVQRIRTNTQPLIESWLAKHSVPFDELIIGKPWCGFDGFYVDNRSIRPSEFVQKNYNDVLEILE